MTITSEAIVIITRKIKLNKKNILIIGDIIAIAILTFIGFATHGEAGLSFIPRMAAIFFPSVVAWLVLAPWFGLYLNNFYFMAKYILFTISRPFICYFSHY